VMVSGDGQQFWPWGEYLTPKTSNEYKRTASWYSSTQLDQVDLRACKIFNNSARSSMESKPPAAASDTLERLFWTHGFVLSCEFSCTIFLVGVVWSPLHMMHRSAWACQRHVMCVRSAVVASLAKQSQPKPKRVIRQSGRQILSC